MDTQVFARAAGGRRELGNWVSAGVAKRQLGVAGGGNGLKLSTPICPTVAAEQRAVCAFALTVVPFRAQRTVAPVGSRRQRRRCACPRRKLRAEACPPARP